MFKKIIYSAMALSVTLLPVSEVMAAEISTVPQPITTGTYNIVQTPSAADEYTWTDTTKTITNSGGILKIINIEPSVADTPTVPNYIQTSGSLELINSGRFELRGLNTPPTFSDVASITGGTVSIGTSSDRNNQLTISPEAIITKDAVVKLYAGNTMYLKGNYSGTDVSGSLTLDNNDIWQGTINNSNNGVLLLDGFSNTEDDKSLTYQQVKSDIGTNNPTITLGGTNPSNLYLNNDSNYIGISKVIINDDSSLTITTDSMMSDDGVTFDEDAILTLREKGSLKFTGTGTGIINDSGPSMDEDGDRNYSDDDDWYGHVELGKGDDTPMLTFKKVVKDFTDPNESATFVQNSGTLNIYGSNPNNVFEKGGSDITTTNIYSYVNAEGETVYAPNLNGTVNIKGYNEELPSFLTIHYITDDTDEMAPNQQINLEGNAILTLNTNGNIVERITNIPTGTGANNNLVVLGAANVDEQGNRTGTGIYSIGDGVTPIDMGYNVNLMEGIMNVNSPYVKIGIDDEVDVYPYGDLNIGYPGGENPEDPDYQPPMAAVYGTNAKQTNVVDSLTMNYGGLVLTNPKGKMSIGNNLNVGSGIGSFNKIYMMNGGMNKIKVNDTTTISDTLDLKIDVDPQKVGTIWQANDQINSKNVVQTKGGRLNLSNYRLLSQPTRDHYTFNVVNASGSYTTVGGENKTVSGNAARLIPAYIGNYTMLPSSVKGAFDMVLVNYNPEIFRGQVAADVIYANQQVINNQLFDRMVYSILPYFNGRCTNKTAAADTLYSPYQYSMTDPGLWFNPYANFETIHMNYGLNKVRNNAYGAMVGADFKKAQWGSWTFIPTAYIGYNGGRTTYNGVGMWHNGGQAGLMGTLTNGNFITMANIYGGGYYNAMDVHGFKDDNALWNAGTASKTLYNIHLPGDFILQPTLYMAYNYVGASSFTGGYDGFRHKVGPLNAFSVAPGLNLIWQKETFSIYALFQAMFNVGSTVAGSVAEIDLPHVGIRDPYFEYGLGASKYFLDRFSGYGQVVARSGSRKGVGFQLGLNLKI